VSVIVVDASTVGAWLLPGQATVAADRLLQEWESHQALAPALFALEVRALLLKAERRRWLSRERVVELLESVREFNISLRPMPEANALDLTFELARDLQISLYDAAYLELAVEAGAMLATRDAGMIAAAKRLAVEVRDVRAVTGFHED
jgi:predicted nucleic acid-binding protein